MTRPVLLVVAPMPAFPAHAGNRQRLVSMCELLKQGGFDLDFAYVAHEDQVYRRHFQEPPTDWPAIRSAFRKTWVIEPERPIPLHASGESFDLDDWCPEEALRFTRWYFEQHPETAGIVVNYVFLSKAFEAVPKHVVTLLDTHDRFSDRRAQFRARNMRASFFHTTKAEEARGLARADIVIAIQEEEQAFFGAMTEKPVFVAYPDAKPARDFEPPTEIRRLGFVGHGNDANIASLRQFIPAFLTGTSLTLDVAGEVSHGLGEIRSSRVRLLGYVADLARFYDEVDVIVAPMVMGTGLKLKVVEALARGKPVIGTSQAFPGFVARQGVMEFARMDDLVAYLETVRRDPAALASLTRASEDCFAAYRAAGARANAALIQEIRNRLAIKAQPDMPEEPAIVVPERSSAPTIQAVKNETPLIATEARFDREVEAASAYGTARHQWFADPAPPNDETPMRGHRLHLGPLLARGDHNPDAMARQARFVPLLLDARPDWSSPGQMTGWSGERLTLAWSGPGWLGRASAGLRAFLLDSEARIATPIEAVEVSFRLNGFAPQATLTPRCKQRAGVPLSLSGSAPQNRIVAACTVIFLAGGLWGRVDLVAGKSLERARP